MQLAKVVIASVLVLVACVEGMPEGKSCVLKCTLHVKLFRTMAVIVGCSMITNCSVLVCAMDTIWLVIFAGTNFREIGQNSDFRSFHGFNFCDQ